MGGGFEVNHEEHDEQGQIIRGISLIGQDQHTRYSNHKPKGVHLKIQQQQKELQLG